MSAAPECAAVTDDVATDSVAADIATDSVAADTGTDAELAAEATDSGADTFEVTASAAVLAVSCDGPLCSLLVRAVATRLKTAKASSAPSRLRTGFCAEVDALVRVAADALFRPSPQKIRRAAPP